MRPRFIPVLTLDSRRRLVKTVAFGARTYIGDPFNVVRLFNEKEVDEIAILDIDATIERRAPDPGFISELASECFIPLSYGGGLTDLAQCRTLARLGVEKFVVGSAAHDPALPKALSAEFGAQAVIGCVDYRGSGGATRAVIGSGRIDLGLSALDHARRLEAAGCGEIILQSIDTDGARTGYDLATLSVVAAALSVPAIALGGAGGLDHLVAALDAGASAAASGSAFSFIGRLRAVLINYPTAAEIDGVGHRSGGAG